MSGENNPIRVLAVDDHSVFRQRLARIPDPQRPSQHASQFDRQTWDLARKTKWSGCHSFVRRFSMNFYSFASCLLQLRQLATVSPIVRSHVP